MGHSRVRLQEMTLADFPSVHAYASLPACATYQALGPNTEEETYAYIQQVVEEATYEPRSRFVYVICEGTTSVHGIGAVELQIKDPIQAVGEMGYIIHPHYWGRGYATEAAAQLLQIGYSFLRLQRIYATCHPGNKASSSVLEKLGFHYEALLPNHIKRMDGTCSSFLYSLLKEEWQALRGREKDLGFNASSVLSHLLELES
ncbi:acetyltransferase [Fictibacillus macauensis ZFHKF-1]|uniref:Acetyltransferase n=1 Tax=Fictibacillus macauensis ZFHKF-1 TaxID=1196324 RepID=I8UHT0_9BACL|nr:GNAT family N-acetyltransferase [Fictibacillus macauensis]EIT86388.1 acetyltransferase [Fictibacillus macauensis ZFHKF-1]